MYCIVWYNTIPYGRQSVQQFPGSSRWEVSSTFYLSDDVTVLLENVIEMNNHKGNLNLVAHCLHVLLPRPKASDSSIPMEL